jgi:hypothetical protein
MYILFYLVYYTKYVTGRQEVNILNVVIMSSPGEFFGNNLKVNSLRNYFMLSIILLL